MGVVDKMVNRALRPGKLIVAAGSGSPRFRRRRLWLVVVAVLAGLLVLPVLTLLMLTAGPAMDPRLRPEPGDGGGAVLPGPGWIGPHREVMP